MNRDYQEDFVGENGQYNNNCIDCGNLFVGHKRRVICKKCYIEGLRNLVELYDRENEEDSEDESEEGLAKDMESDSGVYYHFQCITCGEDFTGFKHRSVCYECAQKKEVREVIGKVIDDYHSVLEAMQNYDYCETNGVSSRMCERGKKGCVIKHND